MSEIQRQNIFDPESEDLQFDALDGLGFDKLQVNDLCSPEAIHLLVHMQKISLKELKSAKLREQHLLENNERLRGDRENLRIKVAELNVLTRVSWFEIPVSILSGFAINILTSDKSNVTGWFMLIISVTLLVSIRLGLLNKNK